MTDKITFQEHADDKPPARSLRDRLGRVRFALTVVGVVIAGLTIGIGISIVVETLRRPPIVTPTHGELGHGTLASIVMEQTRR